NIKFKAAKEMTKSGITVLVAEDHPIVADGIVAILAKAKDMIVVGQARNGAEAIELLKLHQPDVVLLDLRMPFVDGIGVMRWIRDSGSNVRTVILTIYRSASDVSQASQAGADAYLVKDASPSEILKTIRRVHQRSASMSPECVKGLAYTRDPADWKRLDLDIL